MKILFRPEDIVIFTRSNSGAAVLPEVLKSKLILKNKSCKIYTTENIKQSINIYSKFITNQNIGILTGSLYSAGDFLSEHRA